MSQSKRVKRILKVFVDSSVLIAAAISSTGSARELLSQGLQNQFHLYFSEEVLAESERNLSLKAPNVLKDYYIFRKHFETNLIKTSKSKILKIGKFIEIKDAPIVAGAISSKADYLVTYDRKHLLQHKQEIKKNFKVKVVTPDELLK